MASKITPQRVPELARQRHGANENGHWATPANAGGQTPNMCERRRASQRPEEAQTNAQNWRNKAYQPHTHTHDGNDAHKGDAPDPSNARSLRPSRRYPWRAWAWPWNTHCPQMEAMAKEDTKPKQPQDNNQAALKGGAQGPRGTNLGGLAKPTREMQTTYRRPTLRPNLPRAVLGANLSQRLSRVGFLAKPPPHPKTCPPAPQTEIPKPPEASLPKLGT